MVAYCIQVINSIESWITMCKLSTGSLRIIDQAAHDKVVVSNCCVLVFADEIFSRLKCWNHR